MALCPSFDVRGAGTGPTTPLTFQFGSSSARHTSKLTVPPLQWYGRSPLPEATAERQLPWLVRASANAGYDLLSTTAGHAKPPPPRSTAVCKQPRGGAACSFHGSGVREGCPHYGDFAWPKKKGGSAESEGPSAQVQRCRRWSSPRAEQRPTIVGPLCCSWRWGQFEEEFVGRILGPSGSGSRIVVGFAVSSDPTHVTAT